MDKYRILNKDLYVNLVNDNYANEEIITDKLRKSSPKILIQRLIENNENTDMQIKIGQWTFDCHLSVLQCYAWYFRRDYFRAERFAELPIEQVSPTTFTKIYDWMISVEPEIQREEIVELFISAYYLDVKELIKQIWACLSNGELINENEAYLLYYEAALAHVKCIRELMLARISKFFLILVAFREFVFMSVDDLCCLMSSDAIGVNTEIEVFMACLRWLAYEWRERKKFLSKIMQTVRFGLIPPGFLIELDRDMIEQPVIKAVMRRPKVKQLVIDGLKLATTQFCYGSSINVKPRQWLYDEKCDYHLKVNQLLDYKITYEKFHEYLYFLQKCNKDHWQAFVYIKTEQRAISKPVDLSHFKLLQESAETCTVQTTVNGDDLNKTALATNLGSNMAENTVNPQSAAAIGSIIPYQEWKNTEVLVEDMDKIDWRTLSKLSRRIALDDGRLENPSTDSSCSESYSLKIKNTQYKNFHKKKVSRKVKASLKGSKHIGKMLTSCGDFNETELRLEMPISDQEMNDTTDDEKSNNAGNEADGNDLEARNQKLLPIERPLKKEVEREDSHFKESHIEKTTTKLTCVYKNEVQKEKGLAKTIALIKKSKADVKQKCGATEGRKNKVKGPSKYFLRNKTILILGGTDPYWETREEAHKKLSQSLIDKVLLYNEKFRQWVQLPHTAFGSRHHHAAVVCKGLVYMIGGTKVLPGSKMAFFETSIWSFNPKTKLWTFATNLPQNRRDFAALAIEGKNDEAGFLVIGGETFDRVALNSVWLYKINEKAWELKASLNIGRYGFAATIVGGKEVWVAGGIAFSSLATTVHADKDKRSSIRPFTEFITDTVECFDLKNIFDKNFKGKWILLSHRLPRSCLYGKFCATTRNELFLIGGFGTTESSNILNSFDTIYRFNIDSKQWLKCGALKYARHGHDVILIDEFIVIIGGVSSQLKRALKSIEMFSTKTNETVKIIPDLPWPNSGLAAVVVRGEY